MHEDFSCITGEFVYGKMKNYVLIIEHFNYLITESSEGISCPLLITLPHYRIH